MKTNTRMSQIESAYLTGATIIIVGLTGHSMADGARMILNDQYFNQPSITSEAIQQHTQLTLNETLWTAAKQKHGNDLREALEAGADINMKKNDLPFIIFAMHHNLLEIIPYLKKKDTNLEVRYRGEAPLIWAARTDRDYFAEELVRAKVDVDAKDNENNTALMFAALYFNPSLVRVLVAAKVKVNEKNNKGDTALTLAIKHGSIHSVRALLEAPGIDITQALNLARNGESSEKILKVLEEHTQRMYGIVI